MTQLAGVVACLALIQPLTAQTLPAQDGAAVFSPVTWERLLNAADEPHN